MAAKRAKSKKLYKKVIQILRLQALGALTYLQSKPLKEHGIALLALIRRRWKLTLALLLIGLPTVGIAYLLLYEAPPEYITGEVERGDLVQTVEAVGTIISEKDLELKFPVSGIVVDVFVDEGDAVTAGQELAKLRSGSQKAAVTAARARLTTAQAEYQAMREGARPEDIAIARAELENKEASLELARAKYDSAVSNLSKASNKLGTLESEASVALAGEIATAASTYIKELSVIETALGVIDDTFENVLLEHTIIRVESYTFGVLEADRLRVKEEVDRALLSGTTFSDYKDALSALKQARVLASDASVIAQRAYDFVAEQRPTGLYSYGDRETYKKTLSTEKKNVATSLSNLDTTLRSLQDKSANFDTKIATEEATVISTEGTRDQLYADIHTFETAVKIAKAQLDLKEAGNRPADIAAAWGRVEQAQADVEQAESDLDDTILKAPIDGTITKVNLKLGEFTPGQFSETDAAMTILGRSPYRIEMYVSEIDIPKVTLEQEAEIALDAFPHNPFTLTVSEIDPAATQIDGVAKYRVVLDFREARDTFKIGMTGDAEIISDIRHDVLMVPARAVLEADDGFIVRLRGRGDSIEERPVSVGLENDTHQEIIEGIEEGDTVIVLIKE